MGSPLVVRCGGALSVPRSARAAGATGLRPSLTRRLLLAPTNVPGVSRGSGWSVLELPRPRGPVKVLATAAAEGQGFEEPESEPSPPPAEAPAQDEGYSKAFLRQRWLSFIAMFLGYGSFYLTRTCLSYAAPSMLNDEALGLTLADIGKLTSILPFMYGISKFLSGVLGARISPTILLAGGLAATAFACLGFGASSSMALFFLFWGANGLLQGLGAPACSRLMTSWYTDKERGKVWASWTASNNIGGFMSPILTGTAAGAYGWRYGMWAPGIVALAVALFVLVTMKDTPEQCGFEPVSDSTTKKPKPVAPAGDDGQKPGLLNILWDHCLKSPYVWLFAISYFFVYIVRQGVTSWFIFYLKHKGAQNAAAQVSGLELGGLAGSLSSGFLADHLIARNSSGRAGNVGLRVKVVIAYSLLTVVMLGAFWVCPNVPWAQWLCVGGVGFALYGPQMLIGLCGAEVVPKFAVSAAQGFLGWISYLGAANAGVPLASIVQHHGWEPFFMTLAAASGAVVLLMLPMVNLKSFSQRENEEELKLA